MKNVRTELLESGANRVINEFAKRLNITPMQIINHNKSREISDMRHLYWKLRHQRHGVSYAAMGREIGRDPKTVKHGVRRIDNLLNLKDIKITKMWNKVKDISEIYFK